MVIVHPLIRLALGVAALAGLVFSLNPTDIGGYFQSVDLSNFGLAALLYSGSYLARGVRWHILLSPLTVRSTRLDTTAINFVPGQLGTFELFFVAIFTATGMVRPEPGWPSASLSTV